MHGFLRLPRTLLATASLPGQCEVCRGWCLGGVCAACLAAHGNVASRCPRCAIARPAGLRGDCYECRSHPPAFTTTRCVADYGFPWDRLITRLKYRGDTGLADVLARPMAELLPAQEAPELLLPMPLGRQRLQTRGFNQAWELARRIGRLRQLRAEPDALWRVLEAPEAQALLNRKARLQAMAGAFMVNPKALRPLAGRAVWLVDDVMTTGATANEAAATLLRAGVAQVGVMVFARTPAPQPSSAQA